MREMIRCTALARIVHGEGHWKVARAHATLAAGYYDLKSMRHVCLCHSCECGEGLYCIHIISWIQLFERLILRNILRSCP